MCNLHESNIPGIHVRRSRDSTVGMGTAARVIKSVLFHQTNALSTVALLSETLQVKGSTAAHNTSTDDNGIISLAVHTRSSCRVARHFTLGTMLPGFQPVKMGLGWLT